VYSVQRVGTNTNNLTASKPVTICSWASAGGKTGICPPLEIEIKGQKFLEILKSAA